MKNISPIENMHGSSKKTGTVLIFSFIGNISQKVLENVAVRNNVCVPSNEQALKNAATRLLSHYPSFLIGLGAYSGKDKDKLRIERMCSNAFRNTITGDTPEALHISDFLMPTENTKLAQGIGNGYCNLISYTIAKIIHQRKLKTQYGFIHIPKEFPVDIAAEEINTIIKTLHIPTYRIQRDLDRIC